MECRMIEISPTKISRENRWGPSFRWMQTNLHGLIRLQTSLYPSAPNKKLIAIETMPARTVLRP